MTEDQIKIKEIKSDYSGHQSKDIKDWNREIITGTPEWGHWLYWSERKGGFEAVFVECMSRCVGDTIEDTCVEVVFRVSAMYDGVRHMYFNPYDTDKECVGYIYYPNIPAMVKALEFVENLQVKYCEHYGPDHD